MTFPFRGLVGFGLLAGVCLGLAGCSPPPAEAPAQPPPVQVSYPLHEEITEYGEYTGRTAAPNAVEVRSRVSGYLVKIHFTEGAEVNGGEVLYEIDPRPYQAALDQAQANLKQAQANLGVAQTSLKLAQATLDIDLKAGKAITELQLSQDKAAVETNQAQVQAANAAVAVSTAAVQTAKLNLEWTKVTSPISGQIGRTQITQGNLVIADQTLLTTIVSLDPLWAYFDVDEPTVLKVRELIRQGKLQSAMEGAKIPLRLGLTIEEGFPHLGYIDFINNVVDPTTGTLTIRGVFPNPKPPVGLRLLAPGMFVRVQVPISPKYLAILVSQDAIGTDLNQKFVYVLNDKNEAVRQPVELGSLHEGLQVVSKGLKPEDRVIIEGLQHIKPGDVATPNLVKMPMPASETPPPAVRNLPQASPPPKS